MSKSLKSLEKLINSELSSKVQNSSIEYDEILIEINENDLIEVIQFLKSDENCKFRQLIDIAGVDYPNEEKIISLDLNNLILSKNETLNSLFENL